MTHMFWIKCPLGECHWHTTEHDLDAEGSAQSALNELESHLIGGHWYTPAEVKVVLSQSKRIADKTEMWKL